MACDSEIVVYIIATHYGTYYTGITNNLQRRWKEHVAGKSSYLKVYLPKEVIFIEFCASRKIAAKKERYIKMIGAGNYILKLKYKANFG